MNAEEQEKLERTKALIQELDAYFGEVNNDVATLITKISEDSVRREILSLCEESHNAIFLIISNIIRETHDELLKKRIQKWIQVYDKKLELILSNMMVKVNMMYSGRKRYVSNSEDLVELDEMTNVEDVEGFRQIVRDYISVLNNSQNDLSAFTKIYKN